MTAFIHKLFARSKFAPHAATAALHPVQCQPSQFALAGWLGLAPLLAESPMVIDAPMMVIFGVLALAGGISFGLMYRHLQEKCERFSVRAQNAEEQLRALFTMSDDAVLLLDSTGIIQAVNPAAEDLFGRSEEDFAGEEVARLIEHPLQLAVLTKNGPANFDATALRPDSDSVKVEVLLSQVQHAHGTSYLALIHPKHASAAPTAVPPDISAQVSKHSHDLNNQLTGIVGHLSLVLMSAQTDPAVHERIMSAKKNTLRAQETNRRLQAVVRGDILDSEIPVAPAPGTIVPMPIASPAATAAASSSPRVLVLDDEEAICALVTAALSTQGVAVTETTSSEAALRACEQALKAGNPYRLVIADLSLPNDITGTEAVQRLRQIDPQLKAIISSGYEGDPIMTDFRKHGFEAALAKPYELQKLGRLVRELLESGELASRKSA